MSGHSKWATTKHKKAVIDSRRAKLFAKLIKNIEVAARTGGGDLAGNPTLYDAVQKAKKSSVPNDNIDRAVKRGSGAEAGGAEYQTIMYEGYGPNGVAMLVECLTDNRNRAAADVRTAMSRNGGSLADPNSVAYLFNRKGVIVVAKDQDGKSLSEDDVMEAVLEAGADEVNDLGESWEVVTEATDLVAARTALQEAGIDYDSADVQFVPSMTVELDADGAGKIFRLIDALEDSDDVQNVYANFDVSDEIMAEVEQVGGDQVGVDSGAVLRGVGVVALLAGEIEGLGLLRTEAFDHGLRACGDIDQLHALGCGDRAHLGREVDAQAIDDQARRVELRAGEPATHDRCDQNRGGAGGSDAGDDLGEVGPELLGRRLLVVVAELHQGDVARPELRPERGPHRRLGQERHRALTRA